MTTDARSSRKAAASRRKPKNVAEQTALDVVTELDRPIAHEGVRIVAENPIPSPLAHGAPFRISRLELESGEQAFACRDCLFTADTRGLVMKHRNEEHGAKVGTRRVLTAVRGAPDPVLPLRPDGSPPPSDPNDWTLAELFALVPSLTALGDLTEQAQAERDQLEAELSELKLATRDMRVKAEAHDVMREELIGLRAWKRKMTTRLNQMGFSLTEED